MYPIIFSIGKVNIYSHGLMIAIGSLLGGLLIYYLAKKENLSTKHLFDILVFSLFAGIIGSRIVYVIIYNNQFSNWYEMFYIWYGGLVSFGGIATGFVTALYLLKKYHENILQWFDIGIIGFLLGWSFGRVGCFLSGDVPGVVLSSRMAIWDEIPVSLFEAIWAFILAIILFLLFIWRKKYLEKRGLLFCLGIMGYVLGRFIIDFWRDENILFLFKTGQIACLVIFLTMTVILLKYYILQHSKGENDV